MKGRPTSLQKEKYRECVCVWSVMVVKWVKGVNRHKLPVTKYISLGGTIHSMITMVNNTVLHI